MTTAHVYTWERTGRDARAPFALAHELHYDQDEPAALDHASRILADFMTRAERDGLRVRMFGGALAAATRPTDLLIERAATIAYDDVGQWTAERVGAIVARIETSRLPIEHNRRN